MFQQLMPLLRHRSVLLTVSHLRWRSNSTALMAVIDASYNRLIAAAMIPY